ncbi:MAG: Hsp20/alpha crystallin family protein [Thaumarchaeota archaeon]|nr:Hsp20/alpha crystallin family protein [Nitrososphaerota archaeon]
MSPDADALDESLDEIVRRAEMMLDGPVQTVGVARTQGDRVRDLELVEALNFVVLIVDVPGFGEHELKATVTEETICVEGPTFSVSQTLSCRVTPSTVETQYRNGVLSVKATKVE